MVRKTEMSLLILLFIASSACEQIQNPEKCAPTWPHSWVNFKGRCYSYIAKEMDWASAEDYCLNLGANLVSIHSENEYQRVKSLIRVYDPKENPTWIGLSDCQKRNSWIWSDGTKYTYSYWNIGEPNYMYGECCVSVNDGSEKNWNDITCLNRYPSVCVKRLV